MLVDPDCAYVPGSYRRHTDACDPITHIRLAFAVIDAIDPPIFRSVKGDHEVCAAYPCTTCQARV